MALLEGQARLHRWCNIRGEGRLEALNFLSGVSWLCWGFFGGRHDWLNETWVACGWGGGLGACRGYHGWCKKCEEWARW